MTTFLPRGLFGGAIVADLPQNFIDSSYLRQVPDHQEVFLSSSSLTTIIIEINEYVSPEQIAASEPAAAAAAPTPNSTTSNTLTDLAAVKYHLQDLIEDVPVESNPPTQVILQKPSLKEFPAYLTTARVVTTSNERDRLSIGNAGGPLPVEWQSRGGGTAHDVSAVADPSAVAITAITSIHLLVVRLQRHDTDLLIQINVPWKELRGEGRAEGEGEEDPGAIAREERSAKEMMDQIVRTLDVRNFGLFGGDEEEDDTE